MFSRFTVDDVKSIIDKLLDFASFKLFIAYCFSVVSWVFNGEIEILIIIFSLIIIDTVTGVWSVLKVDGRNGLSSGKSLRGAGKFFVYIIFLYVSRMVDKTMPMAVASPIMDAFLVTTEAISIFENLRKLGYDSPSLLIEKLKSIINTNKKN